MVVLSSSSSLMQKSSSSEETESSSSNNTFYHHNYGNVPYRRRAFKVCPCVQKCNRSNLARYDTPGKVVSKALYVEFSHRIYLSQGYGVGGGGLIPIWSSETRPDP
ncbi:hypothetical protein TNCV_4917661 [Trichonephila clavipes]|nr:hypothetical protein TNCV_4917661 [Trichonephila clavipes]